MTSWPELNSELELRVGRKSIDNSISTHPSPACRSGSLVPSLVREHCVHLDLRRHTARRRTSFSHFSSAHSNVETHLSWARSLIMPAHITSASEEVAVHHRERARHLVADTKVRRRVERCQSGSREVKRQITSFMAYEGLQTSESIGKCSSRQY